jgi:hypothetical protein
MEPREKPEEPSSYNGEEACLLEEREVSYRARGRKAFSFELK